MDESDTGSVPCSNNNSTIDVDCVPAVAPNTSAIDEPSSPALVKPKKERKPRAPRAAHKEPEAAKKGGDGPPAVFVDAKFFAGMSHTLKQLQRRDRELKLSALSIV
jgi:hypothetical protein